MLTLVLVLSLKCAAGFGIHLENSTTCTSSLRNQLLTQVFLPFQQCQVLPTQTPRMQMQRTTVFSLHFVSTNSGSSPLQLNSFCLSSSMCHNLDHNRAYPVGFPYSSGYPITCVADFGLLCGRLEMQAAVQTKKKKDI